VKRVAVASAGALLLALPLSAQTMRDFAYARPLRGERQLRAVIFFAAGKLAIRPGANDRLYDLTLQYDAERYQPVGSYNAGTAEVRLGVEGTGSGGIRVNRKSALPQVAVIELAPEVDLTLDATIGAAEGTLDLGGLRLSALELKSGASRTSLAFGAPNTGSCRTAQITSGAGELLITGAGNGGCRSWRFDGGVGEVTIDLDGAWPADARMTLNMALGGVTLRAPKGLGLRVTVDGFLAGFSAKGFSKSGSTYTSANYAGAARHLEVELRSALGGVRVEWR
jgi:hypothetical protein